ncbi:MAG TPA: hypothetical protein VI670_23500 [Thermoanaerobaculia bacterium]
MRGLGIVLCLFVAAGAAAQTAITAAAVSFAPKADVDIQVITSESPTSVCSTGPLTAGAPIYAVILRLAPQIAGYAPTFFPNLLQAAPDAARKSSDFAIVWMTASGAPAFTPVVTSRKSYKVVFQPLVGEIVIDNLTWADASDVVDTLAGNPALVNSWIATLQPLVTVNVAPIHTSAPMSATMFQSSILVNTPGKGLLSKWLETINPFTQGERTVAGATAAAAVTMPLSATAIAQFQTSDIASLDAKVDNLLIAGGDNGGIVIVDEPCYSLRVLPATTSGNTAGEIQFDGHFLAPFQKGHSFAKAQARATQQLNGGNASTLNAEGELSLLWDPSAKQPKPTPLHPRLALGIAAAYDKSDQNGGQDDDAFGLKAALSTNNFGGLLDGEETRPTLTLEGRYASSKVVSQERQTSFDVVTRFVAKFRYTPAIYSRVESAASWSHDKKFNGRSSFVYLSADIVRVIIKGPMEFSATYNCGRKPPAFTHECGFLSGFSIVSNQ